MIICFNGIDGSGKTSQATRLIRRLHKKGYEATYIWGGGRTFLTLPFIHLSKRLLKAPRLSTSTSGESLDVARQYGKFLNSSQRVLGRSIIWRVWLRITLLEHVGKLWMMNLPAKKRQQIIVCDRYIYDSVINTAFLANLDPSALPPLLEQRAISHVPKPTKSFFLDVPAEVAFRRKNDIVNIREISRRVPLYQATAETLSMKVIDGTALPDEIEEIVWQEVEPLLVERKRGVKNYKKQCQ